jgi:hypothetical protein
LGGLAEARLSFARKPRETLGVGGEELRKHLEGDVAIQPRVTGPIDLTLVAEAQSWAHATLVAATFEGRSDPGLTAGPPVFTSTAVYSWAQSAPAGLVNS